MALGIESEGGERGAQAMGQVGDPLALGREELVDPVGEEVEGFGDVDDLRWTGDGRARMGVAAGERSAGARQVGRGAGDAPGQPVGRDDGHDQQDDGDEREHEPRGGHALGGERVGDVHAQHDDVAGAEHDRAVHVDATVDRLRERELLVAGERHRLGAQLGLVTDLRAVGEEHREATVLSRRGALDGGRQEVGSRIDREDRRQRRLVLLGVGDGAVARHVAHEQREGDGERGDEQRGDREGDEEQSAPHGEGPMLRRRAARA